MSRFIQGDCVRVMATFPGNAVDFILTDPPYLVGFRDRQTLYRANRLFMEAYTEILELDACFKD